MQINVTDVMTRLATLEADKLSSTERQTLHAVRLDTLESSVKQIGSVNLESQRFVSWKLITDA